MQVIEAALAFAITMLVLSIVCSALVETIHRIFGMREAGFRKMLGEIFDHVLAPYAGAEGKEQFQARMSSIRCPVGMTSSRIEPKMPTTRWERVFEWIETLWRGRGMSSHTTAVFMERLGTSPIGKELVRKVEAAVRAKVDAAPRSEADAEKERKKAVDCALQDVAQKFEAFGREASTFFERRARLLAVIVAIVVAFLLHVDAVDLFETLMRDPNSRSAVLATQDDALRWAKRIEAGAAKLEKAAPSTEEIRTAAADMKQAESHLRDLGVPIGWTDKRLEQTNFWGWSRDTCEAPGLPATQIDPSKPCDQGKKRVRKLPVGIPTDLTLCLGLILGGLLIGLGAPFWTDVIASFTRVGDVARIIPGVDVPAIPPVPPPGGELPTPQPRTPVDVFKTAHEAKQQAS